MTTPADRTRPDVPVREVATVAGAVLAGALLVGLVCGLLVPGGGLIGFALRREAVGDPDTALGLIEGTSEALGAAGRVLAGAVGSLGARNDGGNVLPFFFAIVPVAAGFVAARRVVPQLGGRAARERVAWSAAACVPVALVAVVVALLARDGAAGMQPAPASAFLGGLVFSLLGILPGAVSALSAPERASLVPAAAAGPARLVLPGLRGLAGIFVVALLVTTIVVEVQSARDQGTITTGRSVPGALVENVPYLPTLAVGTAGTSLMAEAQNGPPLPASDDRVDDGTTGRTTILGVKDAFPAAVHLPIIVLLLGTVLVAGLAAGAATARRAGASDLARAAAFGALVGPVWALTATVVRLLSGYTVIDAGGLFLWPLLIGAGLGAAGAAVSAWVGPRVELPDVADADDEATTAA